MCGGDLLWFAFHDACNIGLRMYVKILCMSGVVAVSGSPHIHIAAFYLDEVHNSEVDNLVWRHGVESGFGLCTSRGRQVLPFNTTN